jgi:hypothetical protein
MHPDAPKTGSIRGGIVRALVIAMILAVVVISTLTCRRDLSYAPVVNGKPLSDLLRDLESPSEDVRLSAQQLLRERKREWARAGISLMAEKHSVLGMDDEEEEAAQSFVVSLGEDGAEECLNALESKQQSIRVAALECLYLSQMAGVERRDQVRAAALLARICDRSSGIEFADASACIGLLDDAGLERIVDAAISGKEWALTASNRFEPGFLDQRTDLVVRLKEARNPTSKKLLEANRRKR